MRKLALITIAIAVAWGCGGVPKFEGDASDDPGADSAGDTGLDTTPDGTPDGIVPDGPPDAVIDTPADIPESCTPGTTRCSLDHSALETCNSSGTGYYPTPCTFGCGPDPTPHCRVWDISNIPDGSLLSAGETPTDPAWPTDQDYWLEIDTDTGQIDITLYYDPDVVIRNVRPADITGIHPGSGIHFTVIAQTGAPDMGVFSFQRFTLPGNYIVYPTGERAIVILSEEDATIDGGIYNGCTIWYGGASNSNEGPGAGTAGSSVFVGDCYRDGGGGGGAFGGTAGNGGGYTTDLVGLGGSPNGNPELIPLQAGSGGGDGGGTSGGRWGGPSGGATQIVSGGTLTVSATGWVTASGCGGYSAGYAAEGGGGGGSGGGILLEAPRLVILGAVTANGGGGAAGGGAGEPEVIYGQSGLIASTTPALGGTAVSDYSCDGGDGNGSTGNGSNAEPCNSNPTLYNGGGGGASGGRIRLNGMERNVSSALYSPASSSPAVTEADLTLI
ncbi:MAG: hypothetical protein JRG91_12535 [Deltaproteobacteria bacterium]|nr:hypothetical protein [Deltaproteobacteria bacterium]